MAGNGDRFQQAKQEVPARPISRASSYGMEQVAPPRNPPTLQQRACRRSSSGTRVAAPGAAATGAERPVSRRSVYGALGEVSAADKSVARSVMDESLKAIFANDTRNPQNVAEYAGDIFTAELEKELRWLPRPDYMDVQADINPKMRSILIDWLVEVHMKYNMRPETLFLTINIIDRYLSVKPIIRKKLQLLGVVALLIASKYEEIDPPRAHEFAYITDRTYTKRELLDMESRVLQALDFQISVPTPGHFLERLQRANGCDALHKALAQCVLEHFLIDIRSVRYRPSQLVCSALYLSNTLLGRRSAWPAGMAALTTHQESSLMKCADHMKEQMEAARTASLQSVRRKFQQDAYCAVSDFDVGARR